MVELGRLIYLRIILSQISSDLIGSNFNTLVLSHHFFKFPDHTNPLIFFSVSSCNARVQHIAYCLFDHFKSLCKTNPKTTINNLWADPERARVAAPGKKNCTNILVIICVFGKKIKKYVYFAPFWEKIVIFILLTQSLNPLLCTRRYAIQRNAARQNIRT
jgi:hypothetical protein